MKNDLWLEKAAEIQKYADNNNPHAFYEAVKHLYGPQRKFFVPVRSSDGILIRDNTQIAARWTEHFSDLLNRRNPTQPNFLDNI